MPGLTGNLDAPCYTLPIFSLEIIWVADNALFVRKIFDMYRNIAFKQFWWNSMRCRGIHDMSDRHERPWTWAYEDSKMRCHRWWWTGNKMQRKPLHCMLTVRRVRWYNRIIWLRHCSFRSTEMRVLNYLSDLRVTGMAHNINSRADADCCRNHKQWESVGPR